MKRALAAIIAALAVAGATRASAQDITPAPGSLEVTVVPGGATFFTSKNGASDFSNYTLGGTLTYNITRFVGVEGDVGTSLGITQDLAIGGITSHVKSPNTFDYSANLVVSAPTGSGLRPYAAGGIGGLTMFERAELGVNDRQTFLTGNVGGGVKWYAPNGRWGIRGDYRFVAVRANDDAPAFFGRDDRFSHRVYAGLILNASR